MASPHDHPPDGRPSLPPSGDSGGSNTSNESASTVTSMSSGGKSTPPSSEPSLPGRSPQKPSFSRTSSGQTASSRSRKPPGRRSRPSTAPTGDRPVLLPAQSATQNLLKPQSDDDRPVIGYSVSRGRSLVPSTSNAEIQGASQDLRRHRGLSRNSPLVSSVNLHKEFEDTVMDGVTTDHIPSSTHLLDSIILSPALSSTSSIPALIGPELSWPDASELGSDPRDWGSFLRAYAAGQWDPYKIPLPPRPSRSPGAIDDVLSNRPQSPGTLAESTPLRRVATAHPVGTPPASSSSSSMGIELPVASMSFAQAMSPGVVPMASGAISGNSHTSSSRSPSAPPTPSIAARRGADAPDLRVSPKVSVTAPTPPHARPGFPPFLSRPATRPASLTHSDPAVHTLAENSSPRLRPTIDDATAAATVRWAGAGVDVAPLALPSPEFELTDPMRRINLQAAAPSSPKLLDRTSNTTVSNERSPFWNMLGASNHQRAKSFGRSGPSNLEAITGSPVGSPGEKPTSDGDANTAGSSNSSTRSKRKSREQGYFQSAPSPWGSPGSVSSYRSMQSIYATPGTSSVPVHLLQKGAKDEREDYFGKTPEQPERPKSARTPELRRVSGAELPPAIQREDTSPEFELPPAGVFWGCEPRGALQAAGVTINMTSSTPELYEAWYSRMGYLLSPMPPDEPERRKALYKFNVLHTAKDVNFDRITHLAKLVFNTKMVVISLIDDRNQWHKSETGLGFEVADRALSFCSHTILQRGDEPMVVLDASKDWRFAKNPLVLGQPHIRFYAGAPLRTQDGYNIGSLCIVDDEPRTECSPRTRHALKEFSGIVMRELELWRDKIQLRIRDRIQTSMEAFTRDCLEMDEPVDPKSNQEAGMLKVYQNAAALVKNTLDVDGALVLDVSHFEVVETLDNEGNRTTFYHGDLYDVSPLGVATEHTTRGSTDRRMEFGPIPALPVLGAAEETSNPLRNQPLSGEDHAKISKFLSTCHEGKIYERLPSCFRHMVPQNLQYAMVVPVFNVDKRPFLLLCAYTTKGTIHFLEGFELQYLRAVGVIILSAVLKRRMILADTAKSLFISNISHELRTPLHGILASAELLHDTRLTNTQDSYLKTVQTCAQSLVETVNHVLDFTKLSGNSRDNAQQHPIKLSRLDLKYLIDETVEGCWLGALARTNSAPEDIGNIYSPPKRRSHSPDGVAKTGPPIFVETVTDLAHRSEGWWVVTDRGGIRRVLNNLIGNSIKFTQEGFIQVRLRELPREPGSDKLTVEIAVFDTGKGISKDFLQNRIFQPFSQENPLQTGTGLGLAIVNSIGTSLGGKLDVWSAEGVGTEIRLIMQVDAIAKDEERPIVSPPHSITVNMLGFSQDHKGVLLLKETMVNYLVDWWAFGVVGDEDITAGDILFINEDIAIINDLTAARQFNRPVVLLTSRRGDESVMAATNEFEKFGGWCRIVFKPSGPIRLEHAFRTAASKLDVLRRSPPSSAGYSSLSFRTAPSTASHSGSATASPINTPRDEGDLHLTPTPMSVLTRRRSEEVEAKHRPPLGTRSSTYTSTTLRQESQPPLPLEDDEIAEPGPSGSSPPQTLVTIAEDGSVMLKSVLGTTTPERRLVVLLVDDNSINRNLLGHWLRKRKYEYMQACDGQEAVDVYNDQPPRYFDVILLDLSMPRMNGFEACEAIRKIEEQRHRASVTDALVAGHPQPAKYRSKIFALTGLAALEDKRKAFAAGVDGYLTKPVSLKTLDGLFEKLKSA